MSAKAFIDRYDELSIIEVILDSLVSHQTIQFPLREYVGMGGVGKTALLRRICERSKEKNLITIYLDCGLIATENSASFLQSVVTAVRSGAALGQPQQTPEPIAGIVDDIVPDSISCFGVIALDNLHAVPHEVLEDLGNKMVFPLSEKGNWLILLGSRSRVNWGGSKYRIWRRTKSTALMTFPLEYTTEQIDHFSSMASEVHRITCGHPEANDILVQILDHVQSQERVSRHTLSDYEMRLISDIVDEVIRERSVIPPRLFRLFCYCSVLRYINSDLPSQVLEKYDATKNWNDPIEVLNVIRKMRESTDFVVRAEPSELGYTFNDFVRRSLSLYLRFLQPQDYLEISQIAVRYYSKRYHEDPANVQYLIEKIYHLIDVLRMEGKGRSDLDIARSIQEEFRQDLEQTMAGSYYLTVSRGGRSPRLPDVSEREFAFDRLLMTVKNDHELHERLGDARGIDGGDGFITRTLNDLWQEFRSVGVGVLEIHRHYRADGDNEEPDIYDISFRRSAREVTAISQRIELSPQAKRGIENDIRTITTTDDLETFGAGLQGQLPIVIQKALAEHTEPLILDVNDTFIPWELLHDGREFLALRIPMGKQIRTAEVPRLSRSSHDKPRVLLVGVPTSQSLQLPPLPNVENEIIQLQETLRSYDSVDFQPGSDILFGADAHVWEVQKRISKGNYRIIHFAGHSVYDPQTDQGGIVLYDGLLKTENIKSSLKGNPLIFLNSCQAALERTELVLAGYRGVYTSGIASAFIIGGALACIASIWHVKDDLGIEFSLSFYEELVKGAMIGEALRRTKQVAATRNPSNGRSWATYILYGDPTNRVL